MPPSPTALDLVTAELVEAVESGSPAAVDLPDMWRSTQSPVLSTAFHRFVANPDAGIALTGIRGRITMQDPAAPAIVAQKSTAMRSLPGWSAVLHELTWYFRNSSAVAVQQPAAMAGSLANDIELRRAAAASLANTHARAALSCLAALLDDADSTLRAYGVGGLSGFANNADPTSHQPASGLWRYRTDDTIAHSAFDRAAIAGNETFYLSFWRTWWSSNQSSLTN